MKHERGMGVHMFYFWIGLVILALCALAVPIARRSGGGGPRKRNLIEGVSVRSDGEGTVTNQWNNHQIRRDSGSSGGNIVGHS